MASRVGRGWAPWKPQILSQCWTPGFPGRNLPSRMPQDQLFHLGPYRRKPLDKSILRCLQGLLAALAAEA